MSTNVRDILTAVRALTPEERRELATELEREHLMPRAQSRRELIHAIQGKYAYVPTSSEEFMARKREDLELE